MSFSGRLTEFIPKKPMTLQRESTTKRTALLCLKIAGGASWTMAYREAIRDAQESGQSDLPASAMTFNLVWEAIYTAGGIAKWKKLDFEDRVQTVLNGVWLSCDLRLCLELSEELKSKKFAFVTAALYNLALLALLPPEEAARVAAFWQNLGFSAYVALFQQSTAEEVFARQRFALLRAIGTAIPTITSGLARGIEPAYLVPGIGCACFDLITLGKGYEAIRRADDEAHEATCLERKSMS